MIHYHPSLFKFNKNTIKDKILLIGKVIKKTNKQKTKCGNSLYGTVLICDSEVQINYFTEKQCSKMLNCDILLEKNNTNNEKIKPTITKAETRMKSKRGVKQIKTKEKDLINDFVSPKK